MNKLKKISFVILTLYPAVSNAVELGVNEPLTTPIYIGSGAGQYVTGPSNILIGNSAGGNNQALQSVVSSIVIGDHGFGGECGIGGGFGQCYLADYLSAVGAFTAATPNSNFGTINGAYGFIGDVVGPSDTRCSFTSRT